MAVNIYFLAGSVEFASRLLNRPTEVHLIWKFADVLRSDFFVAVVLVVSMGNGFWILILY